MGVQNFTTGNVLTATDINTYLSNPDGLGRNIIMNGACQVAQRSTSVASITTSGYYTADRWYAEMSALGTWTQSVENDAPTGSGLRKSLKMLATTADAAPGVGDYCLVQQKFEGQNLQRVRKGTSSAQQLTLSFWVKSNATGTYVVEFYDIDNTRHACATYTISASATWEQKSVTIPADTTGAFDNDNLGSMQVAFWLAAGTSFTSGTLATTWAAASTANRAVGQVNTAATINNYWQVAGVQLEVGATAGPFEFEDYGTTLRKCQRYFYMHASGASKIIGMGANYSATQMVCTVQFPVTMRAAPVLAATSGTDYYSFLRNSATDSFNSFTLGAAEISTTGAYIYNASEISGTAGHAGFVANASASASLAFTADL